MTPQLGDILAIGQRIDLNELLAAPRFTNPSLLLSADGSEFQLVLKKNPYDRRRVWATDDKNWSSILALDGKLRVKHIHARLGRDFTALAQSPLVIPPLRQGPIAFDGADDVRIVEWNGKPCLVGSCYKLASSMRGGGWKVDSMTMRMFLAPLDPAGGPAPCVLPAFFASSDMDKNWVPPERNSGPLPFSIDFNRNLWLALDSFPQQPIAMPRHGLAWQGGWSGSSSLVALEDGYLAVLHRAVSLTPSIYLHMFVVCDKRFRVVRRSLPFSFDGEAVEFCLGLTRDPATREVFLSYGLWDESARLLTLSEPDILALCSHTVTDPAELYQVK